MISGIVPVYKVEPYLRQCVDSILNQSYEDLEVLLIDDGSPDNCSEICDEYARLDARVRIFHTENRGLSAARIYGLQQAQGEFIGFVDSDDWIEPDMFMNLLQRMEEAGADIGACGYWEENGALKDIHQFDEASYTTSEALNALLAERINNNVFHSLPSFLKELQRGRIGNSFGNIILFMPVGALIPMVTGWKKIWHTAIASVGFSLCIEVIQLITSRGCFDLDDVILNGLGTVIGYGVYRAAVKPFIKTDVNANSN